MTNTKYTPGPLTVTETGHTGQYDIKSNYSDRPEDVIFEDAYVRISGYYGTYGPYVFAAAPELLEALELAEDYWQLGVLNAPLGMIQNVVRTRQSAIAKAKGQTT